MKRQRESSSGGLERRGRGLTDVFGMALSPQPGDFLRIYNLRAIPGSHKVPGLSSEPAELHHLAFHLHGGTAYGRGIRVLPETCPDVQELKRYGQGPGLFLCRPYCCSGG